MKQIDSLFNKINRLIEVFLIGIFGLLVVDVLWQVFSRYILKASFSWTEELARFSLIWLSILGAAYLNAKRAHLSMDFVYQKLSEKNRKKVLLIVEVLIFLFAAIVMLGGGINLVYITLHLDQLSGTLQVPLGYVYAVLPFSGFLIMCFSIYHMSKIYTNQLVD
ncbi:TRAP transporter small permease [Aestuariivivens insulae]|uniref:TRAP transporter small permease n=1 Tax=Aestuariivivens insulae TaxID=1621988 RepID=UPI001F569E4B|nr:TRAP transporter small permease [Aestuariivivens insulae]